jgi:VWFA-related protein
VKALALLALALSAPSTAQTPPTFPSGVRLVELDVAVTRDGRPVPGLAASDFDVRDSGVRQTVEVVARGEAPVQAILLLDTSASVGGEKLRQLTRAAKAFLAGLLPRDRVTVLDFSYRVRLLGESGVSPASAAAALERLEASGPTALLDAVFAATALADSRQGRPVLLVFSDGDDRLSWLPERHVLEAARETDMVVHAVGFTAVRETKPDWLSRRPDWRPRLEGSPGFLARLTHETGGAVWHADAPEGLEAAFLSVLQEVRERYLLRYEPAGVPAGGFHPVEVRVPGQGLTVRCRSGYRADSSDR